MFDALVAAMPLAPEIPSIYALDCTNSSIQIAFGDPDQQHTTVKHITSDGVEKAQFDTIEDALTAFYHRAQSAF